LLFIVNNQMDKWWRNMMSILRYTLFFILIGFFKSYSSDVNMAGTEHEGSSLNLITLRHQIKNFENREQFLRAAQEMDFFLKKASNPTIDDLCYALDLNRKTQLADRQKRAQTLMQQISKQLGVTDQQPEVTLTISSWKYLRPYLEMLLSHTAGIPSFESREFRYSIVREDFKNYVQWERKAIQEFSHPISIGRSNISCEGERVDGVYAVYHQLLFLHNSTQANEEARKDFSYHFHGGELNENSLNPRNFYDLMVRAGFRKKDFKKGKHGFQDKVLVKPITLVASTSELIGREFKDTVFSTLKKAKHPYVAFAFSLKDDSPINVNDLYLKNSEIINFPQILAIILSTQENRLYLCFYNNARCMLDLHGMSSQEALERSINFIKEKFDNFESNCTVITGRGNHINTNGSQAVLSNSFKKWVKEPELKTFVKSIRAISNNGGYKVNLYKPSKLILTGLDEKKHTDMIVAEILQQDKEEKSRLKIMHDEFSKVNLSTLTMRACMKFFNEHAFSATMKPQIAGDSIHLTWSKNTTGPALIALPIHY
jgi:hypothetical protein